MSRNSKLKRQIKKKSKPVRKSGNPAHKVLETIDDGGYVYRMLENNLADISLAERERMVIEMGERARTEFPKNMEKIQSILKEYDPLFLMTVITRNALAVNVGSQGIFSTEPTGQLGRHQAELLQALVIATPKSEVFGDSIVPNPLIIQEAVDQLESAAAHYPFSRFDPVYLSEDKEEKSIRAIMEKLRIHTQAVRNWGFHTQQIRIIRELYAPLDSLLEKKHGFSFSLVVDLFSFLADENQRKLNDWFDRMRPVARINNPVKLVKAYFSMLGLPASEAEEMIGGLDVHHLSHNHVLSLCLAHYDYFAQYAYLIQPEELVVKLKCGHEKLFNILNFFSLARGELSGQNREFFFLSNPVWSKPIYREGNDFYCFMPEIIFSFAFNTFDSLIEDVAGERLKERRSAFLEKKIEEIVKKSFSETEVYAGVKWEYESRVYETDLIAIIDSLMLIVEAKSHKISAPALRGAPGRVRNHLRDILIAPNLQSHRCETVIIEAQNNPQGRMAQKLKLPFDISSIRQIFRISVSLEDFATLQSDLLQFKDTGWLPDEFVPCPSLNLGDFETIFDILEHPIDILHYFRRRSQLEKDNRILGDELDYLGAFLKNHLHFPPEVINSKALLSISGNSSNIDRYYMSNEIGIKVPKPRIVYPAFFKNVFLKLEKKGQKGWSEIGLILSSLPAENMIEVDKQISELKKIVKRNWKKKHVNTLIYQPPKDIESILAIVVYKSENKHERHNMFSVAAQNALDDDRYKECLIIGINADDPLVDYHDLMLARTDSLQS